MGGAFQQVEGELRNPEPEHAGLRSLLAEKELKIQQVHSSFLVLTFM